MKRKDSVTSGAEAASPVSSTVTGQCSAACSHQSSRAAPAVAAKHSAPGEGKVRRNLRVARRKVLRNKERREARQSGVGQAIPEPGEGRTGRNKRVEKQKIRRNDRLYDELCETARRIAEKHIDTDDEDVCAALGLPPSNSKVKKQRHFMRKRVYARLRRARRSLPHQHFDTDSEDAYVPVMPEVSDPPVVSKAKKARLRNNRRKKMLQEARAELGDAVERILETALELAWRRP